ncbi:hypothetical protein C7974DRAFT_390107 [Boeremia exigua]|uniref:uncharacterized protein n=1 Tax=Boeremia exigua TaxID=749465 RepID=UPI001E8D450F|nr:uncharacterized protein C7974DRAFT_390107 [Boeremia exigua]KAH6637725.1 hypothetical protein C7974DRAFT_390107 [Boeremia exigua]
MTPTASAWLRASPRRITYPRNRTFVPRPSTCGPRAVRRGHSTQTPAAPTPKSAASTPSAPSAPSAPAPPTSIPGPGYLWLQPALEPFRAYGRVQARRPYWTQFVSSLVIYCVGDMVAQGIAEPTAVQEAEGGLEGGLQEDVEERGWVQAWSEDRDWARTGRAVVIGGLSSIPSYKWFLWLSVNFNYPSKMLSLTAKVVVSQVLFTPVFNSYFFGMQTLLAGASLDECAERIRRTVPTSWVNSCKFWPVITAFSFTYVPIQYRSIFGGVIAIGWQTYLSLLNQRAAAEELLEHGGAAHAPVAAVAEREERYSGKEKCAA